MVLTNCELNASPVGEIVSGLVPVPWRLRTWGWYRRCQRIESGRRACHRWWGKAHGHIAGCAGSQSIRRRSAAGRRGLLEVAADLEADIGQRGAALVGHGDRPVALVEPTGAL